jgi:hypothetical protein
MSTPPQSRSEQRRNGHATIGQQAEKHEDMEPKGLPNADRYHAETAHSDESHDPTRAPKKRHDDES